MLGETAGPVGDHALDRLQELRQLFVAYPVGQRVVALWRDALQLFPL